MCGLSKKKFRPGKFKIIYKKGLRQCVKLQIWVRVVVIVVFVVTGKNKVPYYFTKM